MDAPVSHASERPFRFQAHQRFPLAFLCSALLQNRCTITGESAPHMKEPLLNDAASRSDGSASREGGYKSPKRLTEETKTEVATMLAKLPDLKEKLAEAGAVDEYMKFREGYLMWRTGGAQGAVGEISQESTELSEMKAEVQAQAEQQLSGIWALFGSIDAFNWQKTFSFWVAVNFMIGCWLFVFTSFVVCFPERWNGHWQISAYVQWIANLFFSFGIVLMWFTVANVKRANVDPIIWNPFAYRKVKDHLEAVLPPEEEETLFGTATPYYIAIVYMIGGVLYNFCTLFPLLTVPPEAKATLRLWLDTVPIVLGGFLFWLGGYLEMIGCMYFIKEGTHWWSPSRWDFWPLDIEKSSCINNMVGGFLFFLPPLLEQKPFVDWVYGENEKAKEWWTGLLWGVGSILYVAGGALQIWLWKGDSFGMAYIHQLNSISDKAKQGNNKKKLGFSYRGTFIVIFVTLLAAQSVLNGCMHFQAMLFDDGEVLSFIVVESRVFKLCRNGIPFLLCMLYLTLLSAQVNLPKNEPYRGLMITTRLLVPCMFVYLVVDFFDVYDQLRCQDKYNEPFCPVWTSKGKRFCC